MKCGDCGATVVRSFDNNNDEPLLLEQTGYGAMIMGGKAYWGDQYRGHDCDPSAVRSRQAFIEKVTTEEERQQQAVAEEQREIARELALQIGCPKGRCEAKAGEGCVNLSILGRTGERVPTVWPHAERMELALRRMEEAAQAREETGDAAAAPSVEPSI